MMFAERALTCYWKECDIDGYFWKQTKSREDY